MYTVDIAFQTENERIQVTRGEFNTPQEASEFAIEFVKPYIENCALADGEWKVYDTTHPEFVARHYPIKSLRSIRADARLR